MAHANARLIAAASDLLIATKSVEATLTEVLRDHPEWVRDCDHRALAALRAAIAKATGQGTGE